MSSPQRWINSRIWNDDFFSTELSVEEKLLFLFLLSNNNTSQTGIYEMSEKQMQNESGLPKDKMLKALEKFCRSGKVHYIRPYIIIENYRKHQTNDSLNTMKGLINEINEIPVEIIQTMLSNGIGHYLFRIISSSSCKDLCIHNLTYPPIEELQEHLCPLQAPYKPLTSPIQHKERKGIEGNRIEGSMEGLPTQPKKVASVQPVISLSEKGQKIKDQITEILDAAMDSPAGKKGNKCCLLTNAHIEKLLAEWGFQKLSRKVEYYYQWKRIYDKRVVKDDNLSIRQDWIEEKYQKWLLENGDTQPDTEPKEKVKTPREVENDRRVAQHTRRLKMLSDGVPFAEIKAMENKENEDAKART